MRIAVVGAPGSGKSTVTDGLVAEYPGIRVFGVRSWFAREVAEGTADGLAVRDVVREGGWIPDERVVAAVRRWLEQGSRDDSFVLEGMPANARQAEFLLDLLTELALPLGAIVHLRASRQTCRTRVMGRLVCLECDGGSHPIRPTSQMRCARCEAPAVRRGTDSPEGFDSRWTTYTRVSPDLIAYLRGRGLVDLDGEGLPEEVLVALLDAVKSCLGNRI